MFYDWYCILAIVFMNDLIVCSFYDYFHRKFLILLTSKVFILLKNISSEEIKGFKSYLHGFYPRQKVLLNTFEYLFKYHPNFKLGKKLEAGYAYQKIFGKPMEKKIHKSNLFNTLGEIKKYLEDYLLWVEVNKDNFKRRLVI